MFTRTSANIAHHKLSTASWMSDIGLILILWRREKGRPEDINICLLFPIFDCVSLSRQEMQWLELCKVMGRLKSCRAETQVKGSLALLKGGKKDVKIHRMGKEINSWIYYTASSGLRTGKVRLLFWHVVQQSMALVGADHRGESGILLQNT